MEKWKNLLEIRESSIYHTRNKKQDTYFDIIIRSKVISFIIEI